MFIAICLTRHTSNKKSVQCRRYFSWAIWRPGLSFHCLRSFEDVAWLTAQVQSAKQFNSCPYSVTELPPLLETLCWALQRVKGGMELLRAAVGVLCRGENAASPPASSACSGCCRDICLCSHYCFCNSQASHRDRICNLSSPAQMESTALN